jgi:hypothetical protein
MATLTSTQARLNTRKLLYLAPLAGLIAAALNAVLFLVGSSMGAFPADFIIPNSGQPFTIVPIFISSIVPALVAGLVLAALIRFTKRPLFIFNILAGVIFVLSFATPSTLPNPPMIMVVILELMHVVVAGVVVIAFNRYAKQ